MKTKRKLVPKDVVMGNTENMEFVDIRPSSLGHIGESSEPSVAFSGVQLGKQERNVGCDVRERMDGKWMKFIKIENENMEQPTLSKARRGAYIGPIGRPMGYDGLPMGLGPD
ncbi:hypothetical protein Tco_0505722 [Tanacetum coccineum]